MQIAARVGACVATAVLCLVLLLFSDAGAQTAAPAITVKSVEVRGNRRVDRSTILFYVRLSEGKNYTNIELVEQTRKDMRTIYGLGFFRDVKVDVESFEGGLRVIYFVTEKPTIRKVELSGNVNVDAEKVRERMTVKVQTIVNEATIKETVRNIRKLYQEKGYYFARVEAVLKEGARNTVDVTLMIDEGEKVEIETITFRGNESISRKDILSVMETDEGGFFSFITESGIYREDELQKDLLRMRLLYQSRGFFKVQVSEPIVREDRVRGKLNIIITISEGFKYNTGEIDVRGGEDVIPPEELKNKFALFPGETFNRTFMIQDVQGISSAFAAKGYAFADVQPVTRVDDEKKIINIRYEVNKGRRVYIGHVNIKGNSRTRENVVRREVRVTEGALYDSQGLAATRGRLQNTGYFSDVKVVEKRRPGSSEVLDIDIEVKEKPTGSIGGGIGFNSREGLILGASIREENLFGRGYIVNFGGQFSSEVVEVSGSFTNPNFMDKDFSLGMTVFAGEEEFSTFDNERTGASIQVGKNLSDFLSAFLTYELSTSKLTNVSPTAIQDVLDVEDEKQLQSLLNPSLVYDSRNNRQFPSSGTLARLSPTVSGGPLGGDIDVASFLAEIRQYYSIGEKLRIRLLRKLVWSYRVEARYIDAFEGSLPAFRRLFLGGRRAVRGFDRDDLGPVDSGGEAIGGFSTALFSTEISHPFFGPTRLVAFLDAGNVWERHNAFDLADLRYGGGFGVRFITPLGPVRIDVGYKLDKKSGERPREIHVGLGSSF